MGNCICLFLLFHSLVGATPFQVLKNIGISLPHLNGTSSYAPRRVDCPSDPIIRSALYTGDISKSERAFAIARKPIADDALKTWLNRIGEETGNRFDTNTALPVLALSTSGGGDRAALTAAGIIQAFDNREQNRTNMSGLYQAFSYQSASSGSNEMLGSLQRLNWPTISEITASLWERTFTKGRLYPGGTFNNSKPYYSRILADIEAKRSAGFQVSIVDFIGRLSGYADLGPPDGSVDFCMSDTVHLSNFTNHLVPLPIHMTTNVAEYGIACPLKNINNSNFEMTPYEFGSWDPGVSSFSLMKYLGSMPGSKNDSCVTGFDNEGFLQGTSGDGEGLNCNSQAQLRKLEDKFNITHFNVTQSFFQSQVPNPFYLDDNAPAVKSFDYLKMADGGGARMGIAVWPMIHRPFIDVIFAADNTQGNGTYGDPDGSQLYNTYVEANKLGLDRMPRIPPTQQMKQNGYDKRNLFYGCNDANAASVVYMPNANYTYPSSTFNIGLKDKYPVAELHAVIANGNMIGTNNNTVNWPVCIGCLIMKKTNTTLPSVCGSCFDEYCVT